MFYLAQQIKPNCGLCYYNIGNSLFVRGHYKKAIRCWLRTAELEPGHPQINYRIAQAYWAKGESKLSKQYFLAELRIDPGSIDVLIDFGLFLFLRDLLLQNPINIAVNRTSELGIDHDVGMVVK